jgi:hypothetical protein
MRGCTNLFSKEENMTIETQKKHSDLERMTNRQIIIRIDPETKMEMYIYLNVQ